MANKAIIIGGGAVGVDFHLPRLFRWCAIDLITVVEPAAARRAELTRQFAGDTTVAIVATPPAADAWTVAVIASPPQFHPEGVERLCGRTARLVIEKPLARNLAGGEAIVAALARTPTPAIVCHIRRTLGSFARVRDLRNAGTLGALRRVTAREGRVFAWNAQSMGSFSRTQNGGGVLADTGPHTLDLLLQVFDELTLESAWMDADLGAGERAVEANCRLALCGDGVPVTLELSRNRHLSNDVRFAFERGSVVAGVDDGSLTLDCGDFHLAGYAGADAAPLTYNDVFDAFYQRHVAGGDARGVSPSDALRGLALIDRAYRDAVFAPTAF
ncbi:MAG: Gfo/Idh/MocA family protein [Gammaproteobacteria bacterium]